jgi:hypothetical protein
VTGEDNHDPDAAAVLLAELIRASAADHYDYARTVSRVAALLSELLPLQDDDRKKGQ